MEFTAFNNINDDRAGNKGIVRLFSACNLMNNEWSLTDGGDSNSYYFFIPDGFIIQGNSVLYNFPYTYVFTEVPTTSGTTFNFWHLESSLPRVVVINTDAGTRLPYIDKPFCGLMGVLPEKCYFIPLSRIR